MPYSHLLRPNSVSAVKILSMKNAPPWLALSIALAVFTFSLAVDAAEKSAPSAPLGVPSQGAQSEDATTLERTELGRKLFFDKRLSADGTISCSSCHEPQHAFSDGRPLAIGIGGGKGTRNAPSLFNVAYQTSLFWDGRAATLESQASMPLLNPVEHGLADPQHLVDIVQRDPKYQRDFAKCFTKQSDTISMGQITAVLATFERTLLAGDSPFDRYYFAGERTAMPESAIRGFELFRGRAQCATCHLIGEHDALLTDQQFHPSITRLPAEVNDNLSRLTQKVVRARAQSDGSRMIDRAITDDPQIAALGRFVVTLNPADIGQFKTPSLRNVALTAPYMHDGSFANLEQAIDAELYVRGSAMNFPIVLTANEREDMLAFLNALTTSAKHGLP